jgi:hypothetical protein
MIVRIIKSSGIKEKINVDFDMTRFLEDLQRANSTTTTVGGLTFSTSTTADKYKNTTSQTTTKDEEESYPF